MNASGHVHCLSTASWRLLCEMSQGSSQSHLQDYACSIPAVDTVSAKTCYVEHRFVSSHTNNNKGSTIIATKTMTKNIESIF